jgi:hypothetical protein
VGQSRQEFESVSLGDTLGGLIINIMFYIRMLPDLLTVGVSVLGSITLIL